jgi:hypothetical protein
VRHGSTQFQYCNSDFQCCKLDFPHSGSELDRAPELGAWMRPDSTRLGIGGNNSVTQGQASGDISQVVDVRPRAGNVPLLADRRFDIVEPDDGLGSDEISLGCDGAGASRDSRA